MSYVYTKSQNEDPPLWTVGFYNPQGEWVPESDHTSKDDAAARVAWLNGSWPMMEVIERDPNAKPFDVHIVPVNSN